MKWYWKIKKKKRKNSMRRHKRKIFKWLLKTETIGNQWFLRFYSQTNTLKLTD